MAFSSFQALNDRLGNAQQPTGLGLLVGIPSFGFSDSPGDMGGLCKWENSMGKWGEILCILMGETPIRGGDLPMEVKHTASKMVVLCFFFGGV